MEKSFELIVLFFAALATGALIVNWIGLGRAVARLSFLPSRGKMLELVEFSVVAFPANK